jgi:hypothetical protein
LRPEANIAGRFASQQEAVLGYIFSKTLDDSKLRRFVLERFIAGADPDDFHIKDNDFAGIPKFYHCLSVRCMKALDDQERMTQVWLKDPCSYHTHLGMLEEYFCTEK